MSNPNKISYSQFEFYLDNGYTYTGLVEGIGYVYWTMEDIYFAKVYPVKNNFGQIRYYYQYPKDAFLRGEYIGKDFYLALKSNQVYDYRFQRFEVISKKKYNLQIESIEALEFTRNDLYKEYYGGVCPLKNDAIQSPKINRERGTGELSWGKKIATAIMPGESIGVAKATNELKKYIPPGGDDLAEHVAINKINNFALTKASKKLPGVGHFLSGLSIISDLNDGDYLSATGEVITKIGWYGFVFEVGKVVYESDRFIIDHYNSSYLDYMDRHLRNERTRKAGKSVSTFNQNLEDVARKTYSNAALRHEELMKKRRGY